LATPTRGIDNTTKANAPPLSPVSPTTSIPVLQEHAAPKKATQLNAAVQPGTLLSEFVNGHKELEAIRCVALFQLFHDII
jgi:hypothetical protein